MSAGEQMSSGYKESNLNDLHQEVTEPYATSIMVGHGGLTTTISSVKSRGLFFVKLVTYMDSPTGFEPALSGVRSAVHFRFATGRNL